MIMIFDTLVKMMISPDIFFHVFEMLIQSDKKFCLLHSISQEPYIYHCHLWYTFVK